MKFQNYLVAGATSICMFFAGCSSSTNVMTDTNISENSYFAANLANLEKGNFFEFREPSYYGMFPKCIMNDDRLWVQFTNRLGQDSCALVDMSGKILQEYPQFSGDPPTLMMTVDLA